MKKPWRHYETIPNVDWIFLAGIIFNFSSGLSKFGVKNLKESLSVVSKFNGKFYFRSREYHLTQKDILKKVSENPTWGLRFNQKLKNLLDKYFLVAQKAEKTNLTALSNKELANLWRKLYQAKEESHAAGVITTWILDADTQPFTQYLSWRISDLIKKTKVKENAAAIFSVLTSPHENSYVQKEEIELLKILEKAKKVNLARLKKEIGSHADKFGWLYFGYIGPSKTEKEYRVILQDWLKQKIDPTAKLAEISKKKRDLKRKQKHLLKIFKPDSKLRKIIQFAQQVPFLKDYRKAGQFYGSFVNEKILKEVASRLSLSLKQVRQFAPWEIEPALLKKSFDPDVLNQRYEFSVLYSHGLKNQLLTGKKARKFFKAQKFEKIEMQAEKLKGACACPGKAKGIAKIVNLPEEIGKIAQDEIMVSRATYPALVPAMRKASAIVTDEGGITSHAAIVSRELGIPCVIGTKIATQVFKDNDKVEVDATKGIVRKIR